MKNISNKDAALISIACLAAILAVYAGPDVLTWIKGLIWEQ